MDPTQAAQLLQEAIAQQRRGRFGRAAAICEGIVQAFPDAPEPLQLLGLIRAQQGQLTQAEAYLRASANLAPQRAEFQTNLGNVLAAQNKLAEAEYVFQEALRLDSVSRPARLGLARLYNKAGLHNAAEAEARTLILRASDDAKAFNILGAALQGQRRLNDAEAAYRQSLTLRPGYGVARHSLGNLLSDMYRNDEALEQYDAVIAAGVQGARIDVDRAGALLALGRFDEALELLAGCVQENPRSADAQTLLARLRHRCGDEDFARDMRRAAKRNSSDASLQKAYARLQCGAGKPQAAVESLERALYADPQQPQLLAALARAKMHTGNYDGALDAARMACRLDPAEPKLKNRVVEALLSLERADEALELIGYARKRAPHDQWHIACEVAAARLRGDKLHRAGNEYERFLTRTKLPVPRGWSSLREFNADLFELLTRRHETQCAPLDATLLHGTRVALKPDADAQAALGSWQDAVMSMVARYRDQIGEDETHWFTAANRGEAAIAEAWSDRFSRQGLLTNRVAASCWLCAIYFVAVPEEPVEPEHRSGWLKLGEPRFRVPSVGAERFIEPATGTLVLVPAYIWQGTNANHSATQTMNLCADISLRGTPTTAR